MKLLEEREARARLERIAGYLIDTECGIPLAALGGDQTLTNWQRYDAPKTMPVVQKWIEGLEKRWLLIQGVPDTGKSHLAAAALVEAIKHQAQPGKFIVARDWMIWLRENMDRESSLIRQLMTTKLLVIDDIGTENASEWTLNTWYSIFTYRGMAHRSLPTIITTNYPLREIGDRWAANVSTIDAQRVVRRISDSSVLVQMPDTPYRVYAKE